MKLIEYSNIVGFVIAFDRTTRQCLYYHADLTPSNDVIKAIKFAFGDDVYLTLENNATNALNYLNALNIADDYYTKIVTAIREVSGNEI